MTPGTLERGQESACRRSRARTGTAGCRSDQACAEPLLRREVESLIAAREQGEQQFHGATSG